MGCWIKVNGDTVFNTDNIVRIDRNHDCTKGLVTLAFPKEKRSLHTHKIRSERTWMSGWHETEDAQNSWYDYQTVEMGIRATEELEALLEVRELKG